MEPITMSSVSEKRRIEDGVRSIEIRRISITKDGNVRIVAEDDDENLYTFELDTIRYPVKTPKTQRTDIQQEEPEKKVEKTTQAKSGQEKS